MGAMDISNINGSHGCSNIEEELQMCLGCNQRGSSDYFEIARIWMFQHSLLGWTDESTPGKIMVQGQDLDVTSRFIRMKRFNARENNGLGMSLYKLNLDGRDQRIWNRGIIIWHIKVKFYCNIGLFKQLKEEFEF